MAKAFQPAVLTANDLIEGDAVWWTGAAWSRDIASAKVATTPEAVEKLAALSAVGPYTVEVALAGGAPSPISRRERIRADRAPTFAYGLEAEAPRRAA
jgi:hypothetical protein